MKTLYESILDDEDVLVDNIEKHIKNPFLILAGLSDSECDKKSIVLQILRSIKYPHPINSKYLEVVIKNYSTKQGRRCCYYDILYPADIENIKKLSLIFQILVLDKNDGKRAISLQSGFNKDVYEIFKNFTRYNAWIRDTAKKYDIKYSV